MKADLIGRLFLFLDLIPAGFLYLIDVTCSTLIYGVFCTDMTVKKASTKKKLLSGGNPQIAKGRGDDFVRSYIEMMPGWKRRVGEQLDKIITRTLPGVKKSVKWNTPFYGSDDETWFVGFHCLSKYVKVAFPKGALLRPPPPGESKQKEVRYLNINEGDSIDDAQIEKWVKHASNLPGEKL